MSRARRRAGVAVVGAVLLAGCGGSPGGPSPTPTPALAAPSTPAPTPAPTPALDADVPPASSGCGKPYPPRVSRINVKVHLHGIEYWTLDSTPLVGPNAEYCREIGYTDGRSYCPVRAEGSPDRVACEAWRMGDAADTGKPGPTWSRDWEVWCTTLGESGCEHDPDNPFALRVHLGGTYQACLGEEVCGEVLVER